ncbi:MAG: hypothetical protein AMXMBFR26_05560 [Porticoccaceae bacterium]
MTVRDAPGKRFPGAFFVLLCQLLLAPSPSSALDCALPGQGSGATVARVLDGDTLDLTDGRRVRLIGVNAPELGHGRGPDQPLARAARERLAELVGSPGRQGATEVTLHFGTERRDRHGRWLAHVSRDGRSVERELTREGLAYHAAIPPNLALAPCLRADERAARSAGLGLWHAALPGPVASTAVAAGGYQRVRGRVERVAFADAWWVEFAGGFTAVIYPEHQRWWDREALSGWRGRTIEVRGWVYAARRGGWRMRLPTPDARLP